MRGIITIVLLLLAAHSAFSSIHAPTPGSSAADTVKVQMYHPEFYKKKKPKPVRKKMVLVSPVHLEPDDSTQSKANGSENTPPWQSGDRLFHAFLFDSRAHDLSWTYSARRWEAHAAPPDSPPPQHHR